MSIFNCHQLCFVVWITRFLKVKKKLSISFFGLEIFVFISDFVFLPRTPFKGVATTEVFSYLFPGIHILHPSVISFLLIFIHS